jgi:C4-dicarboxylate transporter DctM subunit
MCGVSQALTDWMLQHVHSKWTFLILYNVVLLLFGMFLNQNATILILTPLLLETAEAYGISAMEFGTIMLVACCYGGLTPPFATYNFIAAGLSGESFGSVTKQSLPFLALGYVIILIMCVFPGVYMWLPNMVG